MAVTLVDDPAAELHDWYGRYLYFAPDELRTARGCQTTERRARHEGIGVLTTLLLAAVAAGPSSSASARYRT